MLATNNHRMDQMTRFFLGFTYSPASEDSWERLPECELKRQPAIIAAAVAMGWLKKPPIGLENDRRVWGAVLFYNSSRLLDLPNSLYNSGEFLPTSMSLADLETRYKERNSHRKRRRIEREKEDTGSDNDNDNGYDTDSSYTYPSGYESLSKTRNLSCFLTCHFCVRFPDLLTNSVPYWRHLFLTLSTQSIRDFLQTPDGIHFNSYNCQQVRRKGGNGITAEGLQNVINEMRNNPILMTEVCQQRPEIFHQDFVGNELLSDPVWYRTILLTNEETMMQRPGNLANHANAIADTFERVINTSWTRNQFSNFFEPVATIFEQSYYVRRKWFEAGGPFLYTAMRRIYMNPRSRGSFRDLKCDATLFRVIADRHHRNPPVVPCSHCNRSFAMCSFVRVAGTFDTNVTGVSVWPLWADRDFTEFVVRRLPGLLVHLAGVPVLNDVMLHYDGCVGIDSASLHSFRKKRDDNIL